MERGLQAQAFDLLERSRAQSYLALLAEREIRFASLPRRLELERRRLAIRYDKTIQLLHNLSPGDDPREVLSIQDEHLRIRERQQQIQADIREHLPEIASIQQPSLTLSQVQEVLDPGMVLLSYSVGDKETYLFVLRPDRDMQTHRLSVGRERLLQLTETFRQLIPRTRHGGPQATRIEELASELYRLLLAPAHRLVADAQRILFVVDGPLRLLPFGALRRPDGTFVAEWKPLSLALSATVWARPQGAAVKTASDQPSRTYSFWRTRLRHGRGESLRRGNEIADFRLRGASESCFHEHWHDLPASRKGSRVHCQLVRRRKRAGTRRAGRNGRGGKENRVESRGVCTLRRMLVRTGRRRGTLRSF